MNGQNAPRGPLVGTPTKQLVDDLPIVEKQSAWTDEERERRADAEAARFTVDPTTLTDEPPWLDDFAPGQAVFHQGWVGKVLTVQPVEDGRRLVLLEVIGTNQEARAHFREQLIRRGFSRKAANNRLTKVFPTAEDRVESAGE